MDSNALQHYGILGMKWGVRRERKNKAEVKRNTMTKEERASRSEKIIKVGASIAVGLLSSSFGAGGVYALTKNETAAKIIAPSLGVIGGMKYYEWLNS